jgi:hypothetical protein
MRPPGIPEPVRYDPKSFDLPDLMLNPDAKPAQPLLYTFSSSLSSPPLGFLYG